jgi:large subunit ribosomal protein L25
MLIYRDNNFEGDTTMDQIELKVATREVLGKKVRFLRRQGITPIHVYGHGIDSLALQCDTAELHQVLAEAGYTRLINLIFDGKNGQRTVVLREVQRENRTGGILHVDFYEVRMAEVVKVDIPIVLIGESPALKLKENVLVHDLNSLEVECLPAKIPASIELDISVLTEVDQVIRVRDIQLDEGISILDDPEQMVVRIQSRPMERIEEEVVEEAEEVEEAPEAAREAEEREAKEEE